MLLNIKTFNSLALPYREEDADSQEQNPSHREAMEEHLDQEVSWETCLPIGSMYGISVYLPKFTIKINGPKGMMVWCFDVAGLIFI